VPRKKDQENKQQKKTEESRDVLLKRLQSVRMSMRKNRSRKTPQAVQRLQATERKRMQSRRRFERKKEVTVDDTATIFFSKISEGPVYGCCSCHRLHYRSPVVEMKAEKYPSNEDIDRILNCSNQSNSHERLWVCNTSRYIETRKDSNSLLA